MGFSSKAISVELMKKLSSLSYAAYQNYCRDILSEVLPNTVASKEMRELDKSGVDLFLLNDDFNGLEYAFQCKGFELTNFGDSQLKQCVDSIRALKRLDFKVSQYYLVVNRTIYGDEQKTLTKELEIIKSDGKINDFKILDSQAFVEFLYRAIKKNFEEAIRKSNQELYNQYKTNLNQQFYYEAVPFELNESNTQQNPSAYLRAEFEINEDERKRNPADYERSKYFFVIGDFGFGKTSLMFQSMLNFQEYNTIYIPLSFFKKRDFQNQLEFAMVINKLVTGEENDIHDLFVKFKARVLVRILNNDPRIILLFDGMDENIYLASMEGLKILFRLLNDIKAKCVFSMRKSFWEERQGNFKLALPKSRIHKDRIKLLEWENRHILEYVELYKRSHKLDESELSNLSKFEGLVKDDRYQQFYGDIPKRPLFLEMIIQDAIDGNMEEVFLSELYEKYFFRKFVWDNESRFDSIPHGRPIIFSEDIYKGFNDLTEIMEEVAGMMIKYDTDDDNEVLLAASLNESKILPVLDEKGISSLNAFLLNSVLTTEAARSLKGLRVAFAHRSYQEYFTARFIFQQIPDYSPGRDQILHSDFPSEVISFLLDYCRWKHREEKILDKRYFLEIFHGKWNKGSLGYELRVLVSEVQ